MGHPTHFSVLYYIQDSEKGLIIINIFDKRIDKRIQKNTGSFERVSCTWALIYPNVTKRLLSYFCLE